MLSFLTDHLLQHEHKAHSAQYTTGQPNQGFTQRRGRGTGISSPPPPPPRILTYIMQYTYKTAIMAMPTKLKQLVIVECSDFFLKDAQNCIKINWCEFRPLDWYRGFIQGVGKGGYPACSPPPQGMRLHTCNSIASSPGLPMFFNVTREKLGRPGRFCDVICHGSLSPPTRPRNHVHVASYGSKDTVAKRLYRELPRLGLSTTNCLSLCKLLQCLVEQLALIDKWQCQYMYIPQCHMNCY